MADKMRWRYGDTNPVQVNVLSETIIEIGDLVCLSGRAIKPMTDLRFMADRFLGVAMQWSREGDATPIRIATTGVFEFDCDPGGEAQIGHPIGWNCRADNQTVVLHGPPCCPRIGRADKYKRNGESTILVRIFSSVMSPVF